MITDNEDYDDDNDEDNRVDDGEMMEKMMIMALENTRR
jgi:hypothetical protein